MWIWSRPEVVKLDASVIRAKIVLVVTVLKPVLRWQLGAGLA